MSFVSVVLAYFAGMLVAGNVHNRWIGFAICPVVAVAITAALSVLAWGLTGKAIVEPVRMLYFTSQTMIFLVAFTALGYWLVSRRKARNVDRSSSCNTAQSDPR